MKSDVAWLLGVDKSERVRVLLHTHQGSFYFFFYYTHFSLSHTHTKALSLLFSLFSSSFSSVSQNDFQRCVLYVCWSVDVCNCHWCWLDVLSLAFLCTGALAS